MGVGGNLMGNKLGKSGLEILFDHFHVSWSVETLTATHLNVH